MLPKFMFFFSGDLIMLPKFNIYSSDIVILETGPYVYLLQTNLTAKLRV